MLPLAHRLLARAATLVENASPAGRAVLPAQFPKTGPASVIGITGPPGARKSTNRVIRYFRAQTPRVAVLAVDPTAPARQGTRPGAPLETPPC